jgi:hypothetical protein
VAGELVVTSVSSTPLGDQLPPGWRTAAERVAGKVPGLTWHDLEHHGYLRLDVRPDSVRGDYWIVEPTGGPEQPERMASWTTDGTIPAVWSETAPDAPPASQADVVRPGLSLAHLPPAEPPPTVFQIRHLTRRLKSVGVAVVVGVGVASVAAWRVRRRG